jgi:hypothetical protein
MRLVLCALTVLGVGLFSQVPDAPFQVKDRSAQMKRAELPTRSGDQPNETRAREKGEGRRQSETPR